MSNILSSNSNIELVEEEVVVAKTSQESVPWFNHNPGHLVGNLADQRDQRYKLSEHYGFPKREIVQEVVHETSSAYILGNKGSYVHSEVGKISVFIELLWLDWIRIRKKKLLIHSITIVTFVMNCNLNFSLTFAIMKS